MKTNPLKCLYYVLMIVPAAGLGLSVFRFWEGLNKGQLLSEYAFVAYMSLVVGLAFWHLSKGRRLPSVAEILDGNSHRQSINKNDGS